MPAEQVRGGEQAALVVALEDHVGPEPGLLYPSQADLDDLHAILDWYSDTETRDIRRILAAQLGR